MSIELKPMLQVVTHKHWEYEELSENTVLPVHHSYGLDIPVHSKDDYWRLPQGVYVWFFNSGKRIEASAPGPFWLNRVPEAFVGRLITTCIARQVLEYKGVRSGFWKFAEAKSETFPAAYRTLPEVQQALKELNVPLNSVLQFSPALPPIAHEFRFFVNNLTGKIHGSLYLTREENGQETTIYDGAKCPNGIYEQALEFAREVVSEVPGPAGYVLDVAYTHDGECYVLEANPAWCSAWYDTPINHVVETIIASYDKESISEWRYKPDAYLFDVYGNYKILKSL